MLWIGIYWCWWFYIYYEEGSVQARKRNKLGHLVQLSILPGMSTPKVNAVASFIAVLPRVLTDMA